MAGWDFRAIVADPNGVQVQVTITLPLGALSSKDAGECAEIAQMHATSAMNRITEMKERPPF